MLKANNYFTIGNAKGKLGSGVLKANNYFHHHTIRA